MRWHDFGDMTQLKNNPLTLYLRFKDVDGNPEVWTGATGVMQLKIAETGVYLLNTTIDTNRSDLANGLIALTFSESDLNGATPGERYYLGIHLTPSGGSEGSYAIGRVTVKQNVTKGSAP